MARDKAAFGSYRIRDRILGELGYESYGEYLESGLWLWLRKRVLAKYKWTCQRCGRKGTQVHHTRYTRDNLSGKTIYFMICICAHCHRVSEFLPDGRKTTQKEANEIIRKGAIDIELDAIENS